MSDKQTLKAGDFTTLLMNFKRGRMNEYFKNTNTNTTQLLDRWAGENNEWIIGEVDKHVSPEFHSSKEPKHSDYNIIFSS